MFEELPEGLSGESAKRVEGEVSSEVTPSTLGAHLLPRINRSWKALSYFSKIGQDDIDRIRCRYQIPYDVVLRIPDSDEKAYIPKYEGDVAFYEADLWAGLRFPMQPFMRELLDFLSLALGQVALMAGGRSYHLWSCGGLTVMDKRTSQWTGSSSVTNLARLHFRRVLDV